ncbi:hypothetical protein, partial [Escherichia coli]|uniref:hypothetical protein n=1 Tax=Escherichia coli TaxID=562 RepID=UPI003CE51CC9
RDYTSVSDKGLKEYDPDTHEVIDRKDKKRRGRDDYQVERLPRNWQEYINEIALFFLLANPIEWRSDKEDNEALNEFKDMLK